MKKLYLAHSGQEKEQGEEITHLLKSNGFEVINPFHKENPYIHDLKWVAGKVVGRLSKKACAWIVNTDFQFIDESDAVVMIYPHEPIPTIGTPCEMLYAFATGKPIIAYTAKWCEHHPWIEYMATLQFSDVYGLLSFMDLIAMDGFKFDTKELKKMEIDLAQELKDIMNEASGKK